jgi:phosphomannomutase
MPIDLSFGTAGIRAPLGEGSDQLNLRTVRGVAHVLATYANEVVPDARTRGFCVAFDGRTSSDAFAREVAAVALAHGYRVRMFEAPAPTPLLAFCTRLYGAALGVMVTASHNPPSDNGLKVYFAGGAQILPPHDRAIAQRLRDPAVDAVTIARADLDEARARGALTSLGEQEIESYLEALARLVPRVAEAPLPRIAYSALHGVGGALTRRVLARAGVTDVHEVQSQAEPRADLGGLASPNPEHREALEALWTLAEDCGAQIALCHDPDADRLAVLARTREGGLRALSGDEVGALLGDFMLSLAPDPTRSLLVSTVVSAELLAEIARAYGAQYEQTLTGFKWIAERARRVERERKLTYLFGYEEALGYAFGGLGDDKDGVAALCVLLELARSLHAQGLSLCDRLEALARAHGLVATRQRTLNAAGAAGKQRIAAVMQALRGRDPTSWLAPDATREDYLERSEQADLLVFRTPSGTRLCVRPSGTEPKLKLYLHARVHVAPGEPLAAAEARAQAALDDLESRVQPLLA